MLFPPYRTFPETFSKFGTPFNPLLHIYGKNISEIKYTALLHAPLLVLHWLISYVELVLRISTFVTFVLDNKGKTHGIYCISYSDP